VLGQLLLPALLGIAALVITVILWPGMHILPRLGFAVAAYLAAAAILPLVKRNPLRAPLATWGMVVAHFGIAVALVGMAANSAFTSETLGVAKPGDRLSVGPWLVQLDDVTPAAGKNWTAVEAELRASRGSGVITLKPQSRYFTDPPTETSETAIRTFWNGQLYTVIGQPDSSGGWQVRLWWKPFVTLIWAGGALIALGGALALLGRLWRVIWRRRSPTAEWRKVRYA
jgi:cytochrome c-type biogenesis protein CcmF